MKKIVKLSHEKAATYVNFKKHDVNSKFFTDFASTKLISQISSFSHELSIQTETKITVAIR